MSYIDCFLAPVPRGNKEAYEALARISAQVVREHGALRVVECWMDEAGPDASSSRLIAAGFEPMLYWPAGA